MILLRLPELQLKLTLLTPESISCIVHFGPDSPMFPILSDPNMKPIPEAYAYAASLPLIYSTKSGMLIILKVKKNQAKALRVRRYKEAPRPMSLRILGMSRLSP